MPKKHRAEKEGHCNFDTALHYNAADRIATEKTTSLIAQAMPRCPLSGRIALMPKVLSAEDIFPLVDCLSPHERLRLLRLITARPSGGDREAYRAFPARDEEFSTDQDPLAWDAEGWEDVG